MRFVAALLVVFTHSTFYVGERLIPGFPVWSNGAAGVDIFFVISGFVMVISSQELLARADGWRIFMMRRIARIVPLYWIATSLKLAAIISVPSMAINAGLDPWHIAKSFLFLPSFNERGVLEPVLGVGWTLNFEMFFYAVFAAALFLRRPPLRLVTMLFLVVCFIALLRTPAWPAIGFWANTIVIEFVAGMWIAHACLTGRQCNLLGAMAMVGIGFGGLLVPWGDIPDMMRPLTWGIPAMLIVCGVAFMEPALKGRVPAPLLYLGNSSYALYLFHPMVAPIAPALLAKLGLVNAPLSISASVLLAIASGSFVHSFIERPINKVTRSTFRRSEAGSATA